MIHSIARILISVSCKSKTSLNGMHRRAYTFEVACSTEMLSLMAWCYGRSWWALDIDECTMQNRNILEQNQPCRVVLLTVIVNDIMMLPYPMLA